MTTSVIGNVQQVDLEIHQDSHLAFAIEWWNDEDYTTPINISSTDTWIDIGGTRYDLVALGYVNIVDNVINVGLPPSWTSSLPATDGTWKCEATDAVSNEEKVMARGIVRVRP